jgi:hypothetical protein
VYIVGIVTLFIQPVSIPSILRHYRKVHSAAILSAVKMEQERTPILIPSISAVVFEILISFPWQ